MKKQSSAELEHAESVRTAMNKPESEESIVVQQLEADLARTRAQLDQFIKRTPEIEAMHANLTAALARADELEHENVLLKSRLKQFQTLTNELRSKISAMSIESDSNTPEQQTSSKESHSIPNCVTTFLESVSTKLQMTITSLEDVLTYIFPPNSIVKAELLQDATRKNQELAKEVSQLKKQLRIITEEHNHETAKLSKRVRRNSEASEQEKREMKRKMQEMETMLQESEKMVEELAIHNKQLSEELQSTRLMHDQMVNQTNSLSTEYEKLRQNQAKLEASKRTGINAFLAENEVLRKDMKELQDKHLKLCKRYRCLCHKAKDIASSRESIHKQYVTTKLCLEQAERQLKDQQEEISNLELENVTMASEIQGLKDKLLLSSASDKDAIPRDGKTQLDRAMDVMKKLAETQKQDIESLAQERALLVQKLDTLISVLGYEEDLLEKQEGEIRTLKARPVQKKDDPSSSAHSCVGYIKELLIPNLEEESRSEVETVLADTSVPVLTRIQKVFDVVATRIRPSVPREEASATTLEQILAKFEQLGLSSNDLKQEIQKWLGILPVKDLATVSTEANLKSAVEDDLRKVLSTLIAINERQHEAIVSMKAQMETDMPMLKELVQAFGCETGEIKEKFVQLKEKLDEEQEKSKSYEFCAEKLTEKLEKCKKVIQDLETELAAQQDSQRQANEKHKLEVVSLKSQMMKLNDEHNKQMQLVRDLEIVQKKKENDWISEKQELEDRVAEITAELAKRKAENENQLRVQQKSFEKQVNELQVKLRQSMKREQSHEKMQSSLTEEIGSLRTKLDDARKQKKAIVAEFKQSFEESQKAMTVLSSKVKETNSEIGRLNEEICKLKLENQSLAFQLTNATNNRNCFGAMVQNGLLDT